jgi:hypothetical protein|tara:strand:- start:4660 stop:5505 length:846 start_codon:yes stop_codon:yes gene_type:complete
MKNKDFAVFILTHGRPDNVKTYNVIRNRGYTGKIYIIIDNEDPTAKRYYEKFGDEVIMFNKKEIAETFDEADNFNDKRAIVYARNASFDIAKKLNIKYFLQLDDDYIAFHYRLYAIHKPEQIKNLDKVFDMMLDFYKSIPAKSIAMAQGGDFIGGSENTLARKPTVKRKCMNSFFCSTERRFQFVGRINEDVNTYTQKASIGNLFLTIPILSLTQASTQSSEGGMTEIYLDKGTYIKSFYSVIFSPSSVKIALMGDTNMRLHHRVKWASAVPVIINEKHKK